MCHLLTQRAQILKTLCVEALVGSILKTLQCRSPSWQYSVSGTPKNDVAVLACYEKEHGVATSRRGLACYEKAWLGVGGVLACYEKERGNACPEECSHVTKKL